jgi:hypothetical protein
MASSPVTIAAATAVERLRTRSDLIMSTPSRSREYARGVRGSPNLPLTRCFVSACEAPLPH